MIKVMIVEDDPMVAALNKAYLEQIKGFELVATAKSYVQAIDCLKTMAIDLILLDVFMPGQNGMDLLKQIRSDNQDVDVILVTAAADTKTIKNALKLGAVDYLIKPFEFSRFKEALTSYRSTNKKMAEHEDMDQATLDALFRAKEKIQEAAELPKGLDKKTLEKLWQAVLEFDLDWFSTEELTFKVTISRVSIRKYLDFLTKIKALKMEINYGAVGRPVHLYQIDPAYKNSVQSYFGK